MADLSQSVQDELFAAALPYLERYGRPGWEIPHTKACIYWMKELIKHEGGNPRVLIPAIILHDTGPNNEKNNFNKIEHMKLSAQFAKEILGKFNYFTEEEKIQIIHLVSVHDNLTISHSKDEQLVFEADCLGQIDVERVEPTATPEQRKYILHKFETERSPLFKTSYGLRAKAYLWPMALAWKK